MNTEKKGFTLIELLVVVLIIGILASVAIPQYFRTVERARIAEALATFSTVKAAQERHNARNGVYTTNWDDLDVTLKTAATGVECTGAAACVSKIFTYTLGATMITATRNDIPTPIARYGKYTITMTYNTNIMDSPVTTVKNELLPK